MVHVHGEPERIELLYPDPERALALVREALALVPAELSGVSAALGLAARGLEAANAGQGTLEL